MKQPDWGMGAMKVSSQWVVDETPGSLLLKQTRATDLPLELAPSYQTGLIWGSKTREQKFCCATHFFARNRWCRRGSFAPGACCRSVLREQAPSCVPAFKVTWLRTGGRSKNIYMTVKKSERAGRRLQFFLRASFQSYKSENLSIRSRSLSYLIVTYVCARSHLRWLERQTENFSKSVDHQ